MDLNQKLSKNFRLNEFTKSATALRHGIDNIPSEAIAVKLRTLCTDVLQPTRDFFEKFYGKGNVRISVTSGYRCPQLNKKVGSSPASFHMKGYAADVELHIKGEFNIWYESNAELYFYLKGLDIITELIWEYGDDEEPNWVHVAYNPNDSRKMVKRIPKKYPIK